VDQELGGIGPYPLIRTGSVFREQTITGKPLNNIEKLWNSEMKLVFY